MTVVLSNSIIRQIQREGVAAYPDECCGILIGREEDGRRIVDRLVPMKNSFDAVERYRRFTIDPLAQIEAEKSADAEGKAVLGFYHSHPDHPAVPSEYDRQHMPPWSFYSHIIVAIEKGAAADLTCWTLDEETEQFERQEVRSSFSPCLECGL